MRQLENPVRAEQKRFRVLDGWRGLSALFVALFHLQVPGHFYLIPFVRGSYLFVDFFFVLSGFIISYAYGDKLARPGGIRNFVIRRFGRLWPLHVTTLMLFVVAILSINGVTHLLGLTVGGQPFWIDPENDLATFFTNVLLIHGLGIHDGLSWNSPSWSISVEFWAYIVFAILCVAAPGRLAVTAAVAAAVGAVALTLYSTSHIRVSFDYGAFRVLYGFFAGHLVYRLWLRARGQPFSHATLLEVLAVVLVVSFVSRAASGPLSLAAPLVFAYVVFVFTHEKGLVSRIMSTAGFQKLGAWSYSIYMVHALVALVMMHSIRIHEALTGVPLIPAEPVSGAVQDFVFYAGDYAMNLLALGYLAAVVAVAALTYRFVEQPGRRFFNGLAKKPVAENTRVNPAQRRRADEEV